jgi:hypothetical protein
MGLCYGTTPGEHWDSKFVTNKDFEKWHTYGVKWEPGLAKFYMDGVVQKTVSRSEVPDVGMYILLNSGMQWDYDGNTPNPNYYHVDWIRIWQENASVYCGDGSCNGLEDSCNCSDDCGPPPSSETSCYDGLDDDCDGLTDLDDPDCFDYCGTPPGDIDLDCDVDNSDFTKLALKWLDENCGDCGGADISDDGDVDIDDLLVFGGLWLRDYSLMGHWPLDGDAADSSYFANDGTVNGTPSWDGSGKIGSSMIFDGINDFVAIVGHKGILGSHSRTVAAWIQTLDTKDILTWGNVSTGGSWLLKVDSTGALKVSVKGGNITGSIVVNDNGWHHVAAVFENDGTPEVGDVKLYVDGIEDTGTTVSQCSINTVADYNVKIGKWVGIYYTGKIDDVWIYDRALTAGEIAELDAMGD